jgi:hypothetical protein
MSIDKVMGETGLGEALEDAPDAGAMDLAALGVISNELYCQRGGL